MDRNLVPGTLWDIHHCYINISYDVFLINRPKFIYAVLITNYNKEIVWIDRTVFSFHYNVHGTTRGDASQGYLHMQSRQTQRRLLMPCESVRISTHRSQKQNDHIWRGIFVFLKQFGYFNSYSTHVFSWRVQLPTAIAWICTKWPRI